MYGTIARLRVKTGMESRLVEHANSYKDIAVPGHVNTHVFKMDKDSNEFYLVAVFESREAYVKNAEDPAQDTRFRTLMELLESEPEWHDGEIVYSMSS